MTGVAGGRNFYGWKLVAILWVVLALNFALSVYGLGILNVHMGDDLNFNRSALGTAYAIFMLMTGLPGPFVAKLIDQVGIRYTLVIGNLLLVAGAIAMATIVTSPFLLILVAGFVIGMANVAAGPIPVQAAITRWFSRRRSLAMAIVISGASAGGVIFPPLLEQSVAVTGSWRFGWWLITGLSLVATLICYGLVKERPEDLGQHLDGLASDAELSACADNGAISKVYQTRDPWLPRDVLRTPTFWILLCCSIGVSAVYTIFLAQGVLQMRDLGYSTEAASYHISFGVGLGFVARMIAGFMGDRLDPKLMWATGLLCQGLGIALFAKAHDTQMLYLAVGLIGIGDGVTILSLIIVFGNWFGTRAAPFVFGFGSAFAAAFGSLAPIASGYCFDVTGSFAPVFYGIATLCCLSAILLYFLKPPKLMRSHNKPYISNR
jgi:sugar phosphate permease